MAAIELDPSHRNPSLDEEDESSEIDVFSDDSDEDPSFDVVEETRLKLSAISIKKSRVSTEMGVGSEEGAELGSMEVEIPELDEKDGKCFEIVQKLIEDGQLEKLKVDQCKVYLRKYGLRLTGNKDILISRIREHLEVKDGGGEKKYPPSTFVLNCKGDSCTGDVVMFEQNVYEMYSIASRSATGPPCGTRTVAGRIVKESYGAAKQQHTFTIEVLWSKGEKPLPPLHPLLIKGRNLYRLMTKRQRWADEEERRKVLQEKHTRGSRARCSRDDRIKEKEIRQMGTMKRTKDNKSNLAPSKQENLAKKVDTVKTQALRPTGSDVLKNIKPEQHRSIKSDGADINILQPPKQHNSVFRVDNINVPQALKPPNHAYQAPAGPYLDNWPSILGCYPQSRTLPGCNSPIKRQPLVAHNYHKPTVQTHFHENQERFRNAGMAQRFSNPHQGPWSSHPSHQRQQCPYYRQGRCYYAENCKFLHGDR